MSDDSPILESEARHQALPAGYRLGEYEIERILGEGGFGVTYLARHTVILKRVAIKEYLPVDFAVRSEGQTVRPRTESTREHYEWGLERFLEEARTLAKLDHPHLLKVSDFLRANDTAYIVMEYVEGESLEAVVGREGRLDAAWVQEMMWVLINALWHVHQEKILHRDIKPENIQIRPDGSPVLIDFGAAREELGRRSRSMTAIVAAGYSPLEQYSELGTHGLWTDIYALAATLYRVIGGGRPQEATQRALDDQMVPAAEVGAGLYPDRLLRGIDWALKVRPEDRPQSLEDWSDFLGEEGASNTVPSAPPADGAARAAQPGTRRPPVWLWLSGAALAIVIVAAGAVYFVPVQVDLGRFFEPRADGMYLHVAAASGAPFESDMVEVVLARGTDPGSVAGPTSFDEHLRDACLARDLGAGDLLTWDDVAVCSPPPVERAPIAVAEPPPVSTALPTPGRKPEVPEVPQVAQAREPGLYMSAAARAGAAIVLGMVEVVEATGTSPAPSGPSVFSTDVDGGCLVHDVAAGHRLTWDDVGLC